MDIRITGRHLTITDPIRQYAISKVNRLPRYFDRVSNVDVIADQHGYNHEVEIIVHVDGNDPFIAHSTGRDMYACIDDAVNKLERQLSEFKKKQRNYKHSA